MAKKDDFTKKKDADLVTALNEKREALRVLRFNTAGAANKNTKASMNLRKEIARLLTEQRRRQVEQA